MESLASLLEQLRYVRNELRKIVIPQLRGCFINGVKVKSPDESFESSEEKRKKYEKMKSDIISAVTNNIDEQIDRIKK